MKTKLNLYKKRVFVIILCVIVIVLSQKSCNLVYADDDVNAWIETWIQKMNTDKDSNSIAYFEGEENVYWGTRGKTASTTSTEGFSSVGLMVKYYYTDESGNMTSYYVEFIEPNPASGSVEGNKYTEIAEGANSSYIQVAKTVKKGEYTYNFYKISESSILSAFDQKYGGTVKGLDEETIMLYFSSVMTTWKKVNGLKYSQCGTLSVDNYTLSSTGGKLARTSNEMNALYLEETGVDYRFDIYYDKILPIKNEDPIVNTVSIQIANAGTLQKENAIYKQKLSDGSLPIWWVNPKKDVKLYMHTKITLNGKGTDTYQPTTHMLGVSWIDTSTTYSTQVILNTSRGKGATDVSVTKSTYSGPDKISKYPFDTTAIAETQSRDGLAHLKGYVTLKALKHGAQTTFAYSGSSMQGTKRLVSATSDKIRIWADGVTPVLTADRKYTTDGSSWKAVSGTPEWINHTVKLKLYFKDEDSGIKSYSVKTTNNVQTKKSDGSYTTQTNKTTTEKEYESWKKEEKEYAAITLKNDGTYSYEVTLTDNVGNVSKETVTVGIDKTAPETGIKYQTKEGANWTDTAKLSYTYFNKKVRVVFDMSDNLSGLSKIEVKGIAKSGYETSTFSKSATLSGLTKTANIEIDEDKDGRYAYQYSITDKAGNKATGTIYLDFDKTAPEITSVAKRWDNTKSAWVTVDDSIEWIKNSVKLGISITDTMSGINTYTLNGSKKDYTTKTESVNLSTIEITADGTHSYKIEVTDNAGNKNSKTISLKVDKTPPVIKSCTYTKNGQSVAFDITGYTNKALKLTVRKTDVLSGLKTITLEGKGSSSFGKKTIQISEDRKNEEVSSSFIIDESSGTYSYTITVMDIAGNTATKELTLKFDKTPPEITLSEIPEWGSIINPVKLKTLLKDSHSGV